MRVLRVDAHERRVDDGVAVVDEREQIDHLAGGDVDERQGITRTAGRQQVGAGVEPRDGVALDLEVGHLAGRRGR